MFEVVHFRVSAVSSVGAPVGMSEQFRESNMHGCCYGTSRNSSGSALLASLGIARRRCRNSETRARDPRGDRSATQSSAPALSSPLPSRTAPGRGSSHQPCKYDIDNNKSARNRSRQVFDMKPVTAGEFPHKNVCGGLAFQPSCTTLQLPPRPERRKRPAPAVAAAAG